MKTVKRNNEGVITHIRIGNKFITKRAWEKRLEKQSKIEFTLTTL